MMNTSVNGRDIKDGLICPMCDGLMEAQTMTMEHPATPFSVERGVIEMQAGIPSTSVQLFCYNCRARVDIQGCCAIINCVERGSKQCREDREPLDLEYVIMSVTSVKYGRVKNIGNYETERFEAEVVLEAGQSAEDAVSECKAFVKRQLGLGPTDIELEAARDLLREAGEL